MPGGAKTASMRTRMLVVSLALTGASPSGYPPPRLRDPVGTTGSRSDLCPLVTVTERQALLAVAAIGLIVVLR